MQNILAGIIRAAAIELAATLGNPTAERPMTLYDVYATAAEL